MAAIDGQDNVDLNIKMIEITTGSITVIVKDDEGAVIEQATVKVESK